MQRLAGRAIAAMGTIDIVEVRAHLQAPDPLQPCGHPRSAIVTADDLGGPGTSHCGKCAREAQEK